MRGPINPIIIVLTLVVGLLLAIKPEKALWNGSGSKISILVARITGIVILTLLLAAAVLFFIGWQTGRITF